MRVLPFRKNSVFPNTLSAWVNQKISFIIAVWHCRYLLPLPAYWEALAKLDWQLITSDEVIDCLQVRYQAENIKCDNLGELGEYSNAHGLLFGEFLKYAYCGTDMPRRPQ